MTDRFEVPEDLVYAEQRRPEGTLEAVVLAADVPAIVRAEVERFAEWWMRWPSYVREHASKDDKVWLAYVTDYIRERFDAAASWKDATRFGPEETRCGAYVYHSEVGKPLIETPPCHLPEGHVGGHSWEGPSRAFLASREGK